MPGNEYKPYVIRRCDDLTRLACDLGFNKDEVWAHEQNAQLAEKRDDPDLLAVGDILHVPKTPTHRAPFVAGDHNRYVARIPLREIHLVLQSPEGKPLANEPYELTAFAPKNAPETTDSNGGLELHVPVELRRFSVLLPRVNTLFQVQVSDQDPDSEDTGVAKRLVNLGYLSASRMADENSVVTALVRFQLDEDLEPTGEADERTKARLRVRAGG